MKRVSRSNYQADTLYPRVAKAVAELLRDGRAVSMPAVFVKMGILTEAKLRDWREGRVPYLERVVLGNLSKTSRIVRIFSLHAYAVGLHAAPPHAGGNVRRKGRRLRFSKTGDRALEEAYGRVFVARRGTDSDEAALVAPSNNELQRTRPAQAMEPRR